MTENIHLTFDIDWAPDWCIHDIATILIEKQIKATWFVTHDSPVLQRLRNHSDLFELGIHPNFQKGSTQGDTPSEVLEYLLKIVPDARSVRTHGLVQSSHLLKVMREDFNIQYDVSILLPYTQKIEPHKIYISNNQYITRIPFFWEDDLYFLSPDKTFSFSEAGYYVPGIKIFNFHPIHLCLNSNSMDSYNESKDKFPCITDLPQASVNSFQNKNKGTMTFFSDVVEHMVAYSQCGSTITEVGDYYLSY